MGTAEQTNKGALGSFFQVFFSLGEKQRRCPRAFFLWLQCWRGKCIRVTALMSSQFLFPRNPAAEVSTPGLSFSWRASGWGPPSFSGWLWRFDPPSPAITPKRVFYYLHCKRRKNMQMGGVRVGPPSFLTPSRAIPWHVKRKLWYKGPHGISVTQR